MNYPNKSIDVAEKIEKEKKSRKIENMKCIKNTRYTYILRL